MEAFLSRKWHIYAGGLSSFMRLWPSHPGEERPQEGQLWMEQKVGAPLMVSRTTVSRFCLRISRNVEHTFFSPLFSRSISEATQTSTFSSMVQTSSNWTQSPCLCLSCMASFILWVKHVDAQSHSRVVWERALETSGIYWVFLNKQDKVSSSRFFTIILVISGHTLQFINIQPFFVVSNTGQFLS